MTDTVCVKRFVDHCKWTFSGIECGDVGVPLSDHMKVLIISREVGGRAVFSCIQGYGLQGPAETVCQPNGEWATPFPTCDGS